MDGVITIDNPIELRREVIEIFYREILEREPDEDGLENHTHSGLPLEYIYILLKKSTEADDLREEKERQEAIKSACRKLPLSLAMIVKDNEDSVEISINSVKEIVSEVVVLDTGSSDNTPEICESLGARVYKCNFNDFGNMKTLVSHLCRLPWILVLDSDETILEEDLDLFKGLLEKEDVDAWSLPRKRWLDLDMTTQLETNIYPDFQTRLFKNKFEIKYTRRVHEVLTGASDVRNAVDGPHIQHFQDSFKAGSRLASRNELYKTLYEMDLGDGVEHSGPAIAEIDDATNY